MTPEVFLPLAVGAARSGGHIWPAYAACEAAEESAWGESGLARRANNLFGQKAPEHPHPGWNYPTIILPTHEWAAGELAPATAEWPEFPDWATSFRERMALLEWLKARYSDYAMALAAPDGDTFVRCVSRTWSTDPQRAASVLAIYERHEPLLSGLTGAAAPTPSSSSGFAGPR